MNVLGGFIILCFACFEGFCPFQCTNLYENSNILELMNVLGGFIIYFPFLILGVPKIGLFCDVNVLKDSAPFNATFFSKIQTYTCMNK